MGKERPDRILLAVEAALANIVIAADLTVDGTDRFVNVNSLGDVDSLERERVFGLALIEGPYEVPEKSRCRDEMRLDIGVRYLNRPQSRARMVMDAPRVRRALRAISSVSYGTPPVAVNGDPVATIHGPLYDYSAFASEGWVLARYTVTVSYETEVI